MVGTPADSDAGANAGAAYLYREDRTTLLWSLERKLVGSDSVAGDDYGRGVAVGEGTVAVGSYLHDIGALNTGAANVDVDTNALPTTPIAVAQPGETWNFQAWYRDGGTSNFTNGVAVLFQ
ncbi:MAG: hypothetical protein GY711_34605 [bacterium]|nr:hypothetical protein [bacterium]